MELRWLKQEDLVSGRVYMFKDGSVRIYLGVEKTARSYATVFYTLCGLVTKEVSKTERELVWKETQLEIIRTYLLKAIRSPIEPELIKRVRVSSLYPLNEFSVTIEDVKGIISSDKSLNIVTSDEIKDIHIITSNVVANNQIEMGKVYLCLSTYLDNSFRKFTATKDVNPVVRDTPYTPFVPLYISSGYKRIVGVPICDVEEFLKDPDSYVSGAYNSGNVDYLWNKRLLIPHDDFEFLLNKSIGEETLNHILGEVGSVRGLNSYGIDYTNC